MLPKNYIITDLVREISYKMSLGELNNDMKVLSRSMIKS